MVKLIEVGNESARDSLVVAAKNIRIELADRFPGVKFAVKSKRFSMGNDINVGWMDGPTSKDVDTIIQKYSAGSFDGMVDLYTYNHDPFTDKHGDAKYVNSNRHYSDKFVARAIAALKVKYAATEVPTVEDFNMGRARGTPLDISQGGYHCDWQSLIHQWCAENTCTTYATVVPLTSKTSSNSGKTALAKMGL